jgi:hypothetical protein
MKLTIKHKQIVILALLLVTFLITLIQGCGSTSGDDCKAPDGSTITITPSSQTIDTGGTGIAFPTSLDWTVKVALPDGTIMAKACINVSGTFAVPNGYALYQFQFYPSSVTPNLPVNSGFNAQTDDSGQYTFSTLISAGSGTWNDTIYVRSGSNSGNATVTVN